MQNFSKQRSPKAFLTAAAEAAGIPLVEELFALGYIEQVQLADNVITITKTTAIGWFEASEQLKKLIEKLLPTHDASFTPAPPQQAVINLCLNDVFFPVGGRKRPR